MADQEPKTALLVEDEALIRMDFADTLRASGYLVHEAADAAEAIEILETHPEIRVVFTDIQMPGGMDGLQLSHYVRKRWPLTIIVICSANELPSPDMMPNEASFLPKPYEAKAVARRLLQVEAELDLRKA